MHGHLMLNLIGQASLRPRNHQTIAPRMCSRVTGRHPPIIGRIPLRPPTSGHRPTASPKTRRLPSRRTIVRRMCSRVIGRPPKIDRMLLHLPTSGHRPTASPRTRRLLSRRIIVRAPLHLPTSDLRRISSRGARPASSPTVPRVHRHQKIGVPRLVRNSRATSMLLPKTMPIRRIRLLPDRTTIRLIKRRRTRRGTSCRLGFELISGENGQGHYFIRQCQASGRDGNPARRLRYSPAEGIGKTALMTVPGLPAATSNWPPNCKTRSRIPAIPTPSFLFFLGSSSVASDGIPLP